LHDELGAVRERTVEARDVGPAEALLLRTVQDVEPRESGRQLVSDPAGAVGRAVVDDQHAAVGRQDVLERAHHRLEVVALVVGRKTDGDAHRRPYHRYTWRRSSRGTTSWQASSTCSPT